MSERCLPFAKLQGAGNDFVVVDGRRDLPGGTMDWAALARRLCDRHFGVGGDGLLVAARPQAPGATQRMRMFNPDGSEAEMCGNGLRCFVRWLLDRGEIAPGRTAVETGAGLLVADAGSDGWIAVNMGPPHFSPPEIPLSPAAAAGQPAAGPVLHLPIALAAAGGALDATCLSMGNPHAVVFVPDTEVTSVEAVGPHVERHPFFPARTNVEFCQVISERRLRVRVWERGAGVTLACGTGACAAMVAARLRRYVGERVAVELPGGELEVEWPASPEPAAANGPPPDVVLRGTAEHVFDGQWLRPV